jgi:hypothetical protein
MADSSRLIDLRKRFGSALARALPEIAKLHEISVSKDIVLLVTDIVDTMFSDNPRRLSRELDDAKVDRLPPKDLSVSLATTFVSQMARNALYEGRHEFRRGDVYLAMIDFRKFHGWPWGE